MNMWLVLGFFSDLHHFGRVLQRRKASNKWSSHFWKFSGIAAEGENTRFEASWWAFRFLCHRIHLHCFDGSSSFWGITLERIHERSLHSTQLILIFIQSKINKCFLSLLQVLVILIYGVLLYVIMAHVARNLTTLREQLQHIQEEGVHMMHSAIYTKYTMFK